MRTERMSRPRDRVIAGVCAGFAAHTGLPVGAVRAGAAALTFAGGAGALLYVWLWIATPNSDAPPPARRRDLATAPVASSRSGMRATQVGDAEPIPRTEGGQQSPWTASAGFSAILVGSGLFAVGAVLLANQLGANIQTPVAVPLIVVAVGLSLAWQQVGELLPGTAARPAARPYANVVGAVGLITVGVLLLFAGGETPNVWTMFAAAIAVLLAVLVALAPWFIKLTRDLGDERAAREREDEREAIAAHLHDSVLQTLAVIQQKSAPHSDVARLARSQERELREWLFADTSGPVDARATSPDLATSLRQHADWLEREYPVTFEIVPIGSPPRDGVDALAGATREAMTNAAKHAGGAVTVSVETSATRVRVDVLDRGPGFDPGQIPADRHGVRDSIRARLEHAGGTVRFGPGPGGAGTAVTLESARASTGTASAGGTAAGGGSTATASASTPSTRTASTADDETPPDGNRDANGRITKTPHTQASQEATHD